MAQLRLPVQGRLAVLRDMPQQGTCWFQTGGLLQLRGKRKTAYLSSFSRSWAPPHTRSCTTSATAAAASRERAAAAAPVAAAAKSGEALVRALGRLRATALIRAAHAATRAGAASPTSHAERLRRARGEAGAAVAEQEAGSARKFTRTSAVRATSTTESAPADEATTTAGATGDEQTAATARRAGPVRPTGEGPARSEPSRKETAKLFERRKPRGGGSTAAPAGRLAYNATTVEPLFLTQPRRYVSACSSAGSAAAVAAESADRGEQQYQSFSGSSSRIESSVADALSARVEHQQATAEERLTRGINDRTKFVLESGEIVPAAFAATKHVKDFRLLPVGRLLEELRKRRQELLLEWQKTAELKIRRASAAVQAVNGQGNEVIAETHEREQRLLQQRILLLQQLLLPLPPAIDEQVPFLRSSQVVCCLLHLTALIEAAAASSEPPLGAAHAGTEAAASAAAEVGGRDFTQLQHQWRCCCTRLKELVLNAEESLLVLHCMNAVAAVDVNGLLPALVERIEAAYFSAEVQSSPLVHPVFCVWQPRCLTFAAAVNCLPLAYKARLVHQDTWLCPRLDDNGGWQEQRKEEMPNLPTWQTMQPVDMEAYEKKQRRVVRTRFVQAKVLRQTDGRKLAAAFALHARLAICGDADLDSLVACAALAAAAPVRSFRGNFMTESLDFLAAELLRRPVTEIAPAVLPLTSLLAGIGPFPLKQQLFAHLATATRTWLSSRTPKEQAEAPFVEGGNAGRRAVSRKAELLLLQQLQHVPFNLQLLFEPLSQNRGKNNNVVRDGEMLGGSPWVFQCQVNRRRQQRQQEQQEAQETTISRRTAALLFARLLCNFLFVEVYRAPYSLLVLLSRHLLRILQSTGNDSNNGNSSSAQSRRSTTTWKGSSSTGGSRSALEEQEKADCQCPLPLAAMAAIVDGAATAGFAYALLLHELLQQLQRLPRQCFENDGSSTGGAVGDAEWAATKSCEVLAQWEGTPSDVAVLLQGLVTLSPAGVLPPSSTTQRQEQQRQQPPLQPQQQQSTEDISTLRNKFAVCAWEVLHPLLSRLRKDTRFLIFNSLCCLTSSPSSTSLHEFEEALQEFVEDNPELLDVNAVGTLFNSS